MSQPSSGLNRHLASRGSKRTWAHKFACAFKGLKTGIRGHSSFSVHFFAAMTVVSMALALGCTLIEWAVLVLCVAGVLVSELFNSAIEELVRRFPESEREDYWSVLDIAAGAVLAASFFSSLVGLLVLGNRFVAVWIDQSAHR